MVFITLKLQFVNNWSNKVLHNEYSSQEDSDLQDLSQVTLRAVKKTRHLFSVRVVEIKYRFSYHFPEFSLFVQKISVQRALLSCWKLLQFCVRSILDFGTQAQCLRITEKSLIQHYKLQSYVSILSGQKFIKNGKNGQFLKLAVKYIVLPVR